MKPLALSLFLAVSLPLSSCGLSPKACTSELRIDLEPREVTLKADETVTASIQLSTCGGTEQISDTFTWTSLNSAVAAVDETGFIVARSVGQTSIEVEGEEYGPLGAVNVTVTGS